MASAFSFTNLAGTFDSAAGISPITALPSWENWAITTATSGTDTAGINGTQFVSSIWLPCNMTVVNVNFLIGSVGGTNKVYAAIYDNTGALLANSSVAGSPSGATVGTAANIQTLALTASKALIGPGNFFVGLSYSGATAKIRTVPAFCHGGLLCGTVTQVHGTVAAITPPATFTADQGPIIFFN